MRTRVAAAVVCAGLAGGRPEARAQTPSGFDAAAARAQAVPDAPSQILTPFVQVCEDLGDDARLQGCERGLEAQRARQRAATWRMRLRGHAVMTGAEYLVRIGQYDPIYRRIPVRVGPIAFAALDHNAGRERGILATAPSVQGRFPETPTLVASVPMEDEQEALDWIGRHHSANGLFVDVVFRLGTTWTDRVGVGASASVREGYTLDVLAIRLVDGDADDAVLAEHGSGAPANAADDAGTPARIGGVAAPQSAVTAPPTGAGWQAPLWPTTLAGLGASREVVLRALATAGGDCRDVQGGFRGAAASVCRGLGTRLGLQRDAAEVTAVFDGDRLASFLVGLGTDSDASTAVAAFRLDLAFWSTRFAQQPPAGRHDGPEVVRYPIGDALVRLALTERRDGGYLRMLLVEGQQWAERQDAISRGATPGVTCGLRGSIDERALECARPVGAGGAGPAAFHAIETTRAGDHRTFDRYRLIMQTADGGRVWHHSNADGQYLIASVMQPATLDEAFLHCAQIPQWSGATEFREGGLWGTHPTRSGAAFMAEIFPESISAGHAEWFWAGRAYGNEMSMQLGGGAGTGGSTSFERVTRGRTQTRQRYFCASDGLVGVPPARRPVFPETEADSGAPCGLQGTIAERTANCTQILGPLARYESPDAPAGTGPWQVVAQTVLGNRVWREPNANRVWFQVPEATRLDDARAICADPARARDRRAFLPLVARLPTGVEYHDAWAAGLFYAMIGGGGTYWSASARPGRILVQSGGGNVFWQDPRNPSTPQTMPFYCVAEVNLGGAPSAMDAASPILAAAGEGERVPPSSPRALHPRLRPRRHRRR